MADRRRGPRGPYKKYLRCDVPMPARTFRAHMSRLRKSLLHDSSEDETTMSDHMIENVIEQGRDDTTDNLQLYEQHTEHLHENLEGVANMGANITELLTEDVGYESEESVPSDSQVDEDDIDYTLVDDGIDFFGDSIDDENTQEEIQFNMLKDLPMLTKNESATIIMAYALRHNLTDAALNDLIKMMDLHAPGDIHVSKYKFLQNYVMPEVKRMFYCLPCQKILTISNNDDNNNSNTTSWKCVKCKAEHTESKLKRLGSYFFYLPLRPQLERLTKSEDYKLMRQYNIRNLNRIRESDVINGSVYKDLRNKKIIRKHDISIQWNTDGVSFFNTSKRSIWPIQVAINELPYRVRNRNILLCGLWLSEFKPPMNMYLEPFVDELIELNATGFRVQPILYTKEITIKVHTILASVDSIARPMIQNVKQFNGTYGCSLCLHPTQRIEGTRNTRVYPGCKVYALRTKEYHYACVRRRQELGRKTPVKGVKGPSVLMLINNFSVPEDCPADCMHVVYEGVVSFLISLTFNQIYNRENWYLRKYINEIDQRLKSIKPCCEIKRNIRSIHDYKYWTAAELKYFLFYYSLPCFLGIMKEIYFDNWFLLVYSIGILSQQYISNEDLINSRCALIKFVKDFETLYGVSNMRYNIHLLLHLPDNVSRFGSTYGWSNFPYETFNGVIKRLFHGSQYIPDQIVKIYSRINYIKQTTNEFEKSDCHELAKSFFLSLIKNSNLKHDYEYNGLKLKGTFKQKRLSPEEKILVNDYGIEENYIKSFTRFIFNNCLYHGFQVRNTMKRNNSIIKCTNGSYMKITELLYVNDEKCIVLGKEFQVSNDECLWTSENWSSKHFCDIVIATNHTICCRLQEIKKKCVIIDCYCESNENKYYIFPLVNDLERD